MKMDFTASYVRNGYSRCNLAGINCDDVTLWVKSPSQPGLNLLHPVVFFPGFCEGFEANISFLSRFKHRKIVCFHVLPNIKRSVALKAFLDESNFISPTSTFHLVTHSQGIYCLLDHGISISSIAGRCESLTLMNPAGILNSYGLDPFRGFILECFREIGDLLFSLKGKVIYPAFYDAYKYVENNPFNALNLLYASSVSPVTDAVKTLKEDYSLPVGAVISTDDWIFPYENLLRALTAIGIDRQLIVDIDTNHIPQVMYPEKTAYLIEQLWRKMGSCETISAISTTELSRD